MAARITGVRQLDRALAQLPEKIQKKIIRPAVREATRVLESEAKSQAPSATGFMRIQHETKPVKKRKSGYIRFHLLVGGDIFQALAPSKKPRRMANGRMSRSTAFYPAIVQTGAPRVRRKPNRYMTRAYKSGQRAAIDVFRRKIRQGLAKAGKLSL